MNYQISVLISFKGQLKLMKDYSCFYHYIFLLMEVMYVIQGLMNEPNEH